jgi:hypothetical protein
MEYLSLILGLIYFLFIPFFIRFFYIRFNYDALLVTIGAISWPIIFPSYLMYKLGNLF